MATSPRSFEERTNDAFFLGATAYGTLSERIFTLDPAAVALIPEDLKPGQGALKLMEAWYQGWDMEAATAAREALEDEDPQPVTRVVHEFSLRRPYYTRTTSVSFE